MKETKRLYTYLLVMVSVLGIAGCSEGPKDDKNQTQGWNLSNNDNKYLSGDRSAPVEEEGPQYQTPTMEMLQGKPQKFPTRYPVKRYPNAQVAMVDVRPNRRPGYVNMVMLKSNDKIPQVNTFYNQQLASEQWKKVSEYHNEIYDSTRWEKDDLLCEVRVSQDFSKPDGQRLIQLLYGKKPKKLFKQAPSIQIPQQPWQNGPPAQPGQPGQTQPGQTQPGQTQPGQQPAQMPSTPPVGAPAPAAHS